MSAVKSALLTVVGNGSKVPVRGWVCLLDNGELVEERAFESSAEWENIQLGACWSQKLDSRLGDLAWLGLACAVRGFVVFNDNTVWMKSRN